MSTFDFGTLRPGMEVRAADGESVGKIVEIHPSHINVEEGGLLPSDHVIPVDVIAGIGQDGHVHLTLDRKAAIEQAWRGASPTLVEGTGPGEHDESY